MNSQEQNKASATPGANIGAGVPKNDALKQAGAGNAQAGKKPGEKDAGSCSSSKGSCATK